MVTRPGEPATGSSARGADGGVTRPVRLGLLADREDLLACRAGWIAEHAPDFEVVVSAGTWSELVTSTAFPTRLVIMDLELREPPSIEARIRTCRAAGAMVVVLSERDDEDARERSLRAGAARHLAASTPIEDVMESARAAMAMRSGAASSSGWRPLPIGVAAPQRPRLSAGELEALRLYASGASTPEVAVRMNVQFETAKTYLRRVRQKYVKVGRPAGRRADLVRRAAEDGFLATDHTTRGGVARPEPEDV